MNYNNYNEWQLFVEETYNHRQVKKNGDCHISGLQTWFNSIVERNKRVSDSLKCFANSKSDKQSVPAELDLIMTAIAKVFYPQYYDAENNIVIKKDSSGAKTMFYSDQNYGRMLMNYWSGKFMPIFIPKVNGGMPCYWIEICSALQQEYHVFHSLKDINNFIFTITNNQVDKQQLYTELSNFGLYTRSAQHVCVAYAIYHGYSVLKCKELLRKVIEVEKSIKGFPNETRTAMLQKEFDGAILEKSKESLLRWIENNSQRFLNNNRLNHKTAVNEVLKRFGGKVELEYTHDFKERMERLVELFSEAIQITRFQRNSELQKYLLKQINIDAMQEMIEKFELMREQRNLTNNSQEEQYLTQEEREELRREISSKNKSKTTKNETVENHVQQEERERRLKAEGDANEYQESGEIIAADIINMALRRMLIVYEMSQMSSNFDNALIAIDEQINSTLLQCGLREMAYLESNNPEEGSVINITQDLFDWVVVESLIFEEKEYKKKIRTGKETPSDGVSGGTFITYLTR